MPGKISHHTISITLLVVILLPAFSAFSQTPKGLKPAERQTFSNGKTRALIIGISKYQYIDKLKYADKDAEVFAGYLANNSFWNIDKSDITLLTNEKAKRGDVISELQRIAILSKPGDNLVFYFSGHGDVETLTMFNKGYLLTYDTYSNNYMAGALSVNDLKDIFVTLTTNNVQVIVITDACRSGKLAGGRKGVEFTAIALKTIWHNEIKILSSQPGEISLEGPQWGNGRGVFSYYLINGLNGAADTNKDSVVTLAELRQYFGETVYIETNETQQPVVEGPKEFSTVIARIRSTPVKPNTKPGGNSAPSFPRIRVPEDSCTWYHRQMNTAITEKRFDSKDPNSATATYRKLRSCTNDTGFILGANSKLLSALMNTAQEIVNNSFIGKNFVQEKEYTYAIELLDQVLQNNDLRLPYQEQLTNLKRYLKVQGTTIWGNESMLPALEPILDSAIKQEPEAAYLLSAKGILELRKRNYTKAIQILEKATEKSPGWLIPKYYLGLGYGHKKNYRKALDYYEEILQKDTLYRTFECVKCIQEKMAEYAARLKRVRFDKYVGDATRMASLDSIRSLLADNIDSADFYHSMGRKYDKKNHPYRDSVYFFYSQAVELDPEEPDYIFTFIEFLWKESYGEMEIRELILGKMDNYSDEDKNSLQEQLLDSYLRAGELEKAFNVAVQMHKSGFYTCALMKKLRKFFKKSPEYETYMKDCKDE